MLKPESLNKHRLFMQQDFGGGLSPLDARIKTQDNGIKTKEINEKEIILLPIRIEKHFSGSGVLYLMPQVHILNPLTGESIDTVISEEHFDTLMESVTEMHIQDSFQIEQDLGIIEVSRIPSQNMVYLSAAIDENLQPKLADKDMLRSVQQGYVS